jgi:hypothetical protein
MDKIEVSFIVKRGLACELRQNSLLQDSNV